MKTILNTVRRFRDDEDGAAMVEYSVLIGIITAAAIGTIIMVGNYVGASWTKLCTDLNGGAGATGGKCI